MKNIAASLFLMLLAGLASANENSSFKLQVVVDQDPVQEFTLNIDSYISQELILTETLRLNVIVNPENAKNFESVLYSEGQVIHSAVQAKNSTSGPSFYLICSGKLAKFLSPAVGEKPSCPVPSA
ncbi:hypothetical protein HXX02_17150 [Microbulbifer elongatus]|uniref:Uncharacterized protein n=1 Tax=Microbulbifer elongatus TaxID=86173 RepID=A0ABT1P4X0_9GAMM|nr:hypothetical protein [Microbulbifer elongatus]MCQ3831163.1 hypothetical protein [Microbulbifer elongatus]